jgi:hypothetical protein
MILTRTCRIVLRITLFLGQTGGLTAWKHRDRENTEEEHSVTSVPLWFPPTVGQ